MTFFIHVMFVAQMSLYVISLEIMQTASVEMSCLSLCIDIMHQHSGGVCMVWLRILSDRCVVYANNCYYFLMNDTSCDIWMLWPSMDVWMLMLQHPLSCIWLISIDILSVVCMNAAAGVGSLSLWSRLVHTWWWNAIRALSPLLALCVGNPLD